MPDIIEKKFFDRYGRSGSCGDQISEALSAFLPNETTGKTDMDKLRLVAKQNNVDLKRWSHLNMGHLRMNLGNVLRGRVRSGATVEIGPIVIEGQRDKISA